jgi:hypothetical protein
MKNSLSAIALSCGLMFSGCDAIKQAKQEQARSYRQAVLDSKVIITNLFVEPLNEYEENGVSLQYDLLSGSYKWRPITVYVKDNKDFMVETNSTAYPFLYTDSITWENLKIGDTITLGKVKGWYLDFTGTDHGLMIEDTNNETRHNSPGIHLSF